MAYDLDGVKSHVRAAAEEVGPMFGIKNIGGYRATGSVPNSDHPKGLALDFMTFSKKVGDSLAGYLIANASRLGITYVIWWGKIWQHGEWKTYSGPSPHIDHVHASFSASGASGGIPVGIPGVGGVGSAAAILEKLEGIAETLSEPGTWKRVGLFVLGALLVIFGVLVALGNTSAKEVGKVI